LPPQSAETVKHGRNLTPGPRKPRPALRPDPSRQRPAEASGGYGEAGRPEDGETQAKEHQDVARARMLVLREDQLASYISALRIVRFGTAWPLRRRRLRQLPQSQARASTEPRQRPRPPIHRVRPY